ncbi:MAG: YcgN family cysteine cluster protein [Hyphomicrobiales bacterium]|nr:YcgN family cysteine cluster protein [Hyphomicrobiales bacterium]
MAGKTAKGRPLGKGGQSEGADKGADKPPFWEKPLEKLTHREWESLCDGCGRCCLAKLEDEDTGEIYYTNIVCTLFDATTCRCADYSNRSKKVPDCITLSMKNVRELAWLPPTCAYRLRLEGKPLAWWHPLISGSPDTVHEAGISVMGRAGPSEDDVALDEYPDYIVQWPEKTPKISGSVKARVTRKA